MTRLIGIRGLLWATIAAVCATSGQASSAEPLRLVTADYLGPSHNTGDGKVPGFPREVLGQVFTAMGQNVSFEAVPPNRSWMMIIRGERDGMLATLRTSERERICSFPDEPLGQDKWLMYVRAADARNLKFSSNDDLVGHDVAIRESVPPGSLEHPELSAELLKFLREHHNMVETSGTSESLRMLAAGRVDYAVLNVGLGMDAIASLGLSGQIQPLLFRSVTEKDLYVCFTKARVSPSLVEAFSRALKQFKQTEAYHVIRAKYYP